MTYYDYIKNTWALAFLCGSFGTFQMDAPSLRRFSCPSTWIDPVRTGVLWIDDQGLPLRKQGEDLQMLGGFGGFEFSDAHESGGEGDVHTTRPGHHLRREQGPNEASSQDLLEGTGIG